MITKANLLMTVTPIGTLAICFTSRCGCIQVSTNEDVVDLTTTLSTASMPVPVLSSVPNNDDICIVGSDTSPAAKRRNIAVAKALAAHRKLGQQIVANAHQSSEPKEVETKPKCGICLDEMKEPACGSCG